MSNNGFTLLEMLIVLVIISVMSALSIPYLGNSIDRLNIKAAARSIAASLRYARSLAASEKVICLSMFDLDNQRLVISQESLRTETLSKDQKVYELPEGVRFRISDAKPGIDETYQIVFYPAGNSSGGEVFIEDDRKNSFRIRTDFVTGTVTLDDQTE